MTESQLTPSAIRRAHSAIEQLQTKQLQQAALLLRLFYKSKAQHRRANWFQTIDGIRRCFARLLDIRTLRCSIEGSLRDRGAAAKIRGGEADDKFRQSSLRAAKIAISNVWSSQWGAEGRSDGRLEKYNDMTTDKADPACCLLAARKVLEVILQLEELACRAQAAFNVLQIHLRTPPAPTFAPLIFTLLSLCAQIYTTSMDILWGDDKASKFSMTRTYAMLMLKDESASQAQEVIQLAGHSRNGKHLREHLAKVLQARRPNDNTWLPARIDRIQPADTNTLQLESQLNNSVGDAHQSSKISEEPADQVTEDMEDIGEAV